MKNIDLRSHISCNNNKNKRPLTSVGWCSHSVRFFGNIQFAVFIMSHLLRSIDFENNSFNSCVYINCQDLITIYLTEANTLI